MVECPVDGWPRVKEVVRVNHVSDTLLIKAYRKGCRNWDSLAVWLERYYIFLGPKFRYFLEFPRQQKASTHWPWWSRRAMHIHCHSRLWLPTSPYASAWLEWLELILSDTLLFHNAFWTPQQKCHCGVKQKYIVAQRCWVNVHLPLPFCREASHSLSPNQSTSW